MQNVQAKGDGMDQEPAAEIIDRDADWNRFLKSRYKKQLSEISREYPYKKSLHIDYRFVHDVVIILTCLYSLRMRDEN